jgi:uncharacterized membrane protein (UPF0127 family)
MMDSGFLDRLIAKEPPVGTTAAVLAYMKRNYPAGVLDWVTTPGAHWKRQTVRLRDINYARRVGGARDDDKTVGIAKAIEAGKVMDPVVLVATDGPYAVADGYHRLLAFDRTNAKTVDAWVGTNIKGFDAKAVHSAKRNTGLRAQSDEGAPDISPIDFGQPQNPAFPGERYPTVRITVNGANGSRQMDVGHATTPTQRALGLSNLPDAGYDQAALLMTWPYDKTAATLTNQNVPIPLHAHFFDASGRHVDNFTLRPNDRTPMTARAPHKHCLELTEDAADELGLGPGSSFDLGHDDDAGTPFE